MNFPFSERVNERLEAFLIGFFIALAAVLPMILAILAFIYL